MCFRQLSAMARRDPEVNFSRAMIGLIVLGIALRLVRWLLNYPMWCDETLLAANILERDWTALTKPLAYRQVCPLGFLALELTVVRLLGFSELTLRLIPFLCALASVPLFHLLARRVLGTGTSAALLAVALFAVSEAPIRYAAEVKPYSADLLVSLVLLNLAVSWLRTPGSVRHLWAIAAVMPILAATSLPSVFLIGTVALVGIHEAIARTREGGRVDGKLWLAYGGFLASAGFAIAGMFALGQYSSTAASREYLINYWSGGFPPSWHDPAALAGWLIRTHSGPLFAYPYGAGRLAWISPLIFGCFTLGIIVHKPRNKKIVASLVLPFLLLMAAAALRRYPYGMSVRLAQFLTPSTLLLASAGLASLCAQVRPVPLARLAIPVLTIILVTTGLWRLGHDLANPYRTPWDRTGREFARWFWEELSADAELVCVQTDIGIPFRPDNWTYGTDQYLCLQRIYSPRHQKRLPPRWDRVSTARPLRCVLLNRMPTEVPAFMEWIETHRDHYTLRNVRTYVATHGTKDELALNYVVCEFVPASRCLAPTEAERELGTINHRAALHGPAMVR
jgi:hypothetical protein